MLRKWKFEDETERLAENGVWTMKALWIMTEQDRKEFGCSLVMRKLLKHVGEQKKGAASDGSKEQNAEQSAAAPSNKKQKQNMPGKACDADCFLAQVKSLQSQSDAPLVKASRPHPRLRPSPHSLQYTNSLTSLFASRIAAAIGVVDGIMVRIRAVKEPEESHLLPAPAYASTRQHTSADGCWQKNTSTPT